MGVTNGNSPVNGSSAKHSNLPSHFIGGNALESAPPSKVKEFVAAHEGHSVITSVSNLRNYCSELQYYSTAILRELRG
jgi:acetyl-CoA carboxylase/biotin carboxylase 1